MPPTLLLALTHHIKVQMAITVCVIHLVVGGLDVPPFSQYKICAESEMKA